MLIEAWSRPLRRNQTIIPLGIVPFTLVHLLGGVPARAQGQPIIEVRSAKPGRLLAEGLAERIRSIQGVNAVEKYVLKDVDPHPVIGLEPSSPLRVLDGDKLLPPEKGAGRWFQPRDRYVAIVGNVYVEDYPGFRLGEKMPMMRHRFQIGASFTLPGAKQSIRVVGKFAVDPPSAAKKIILPLPTVQEFFNLEGQVTHFFVTVKSPEWVRKVSEAIRSSLGEAVSVRIH